MTPKYVKIIDGEIVEAATNLLILEDKQILNPTEQMLLDAGFVPYIEPTEVIIEKAKKQKINEVKKFDSSSEVNSFFLNDQQLWLDKATRVGLMNTLETLISLNIPKYALWFNYVSYELDVDDAITMLKSLEFYAVKSFAATQKHIRNILDLTTEEEILLYNYKADYPEVLTFYF